VLPPFFFPKPSAIEREAGWTGMISSITTFNSWTGDHSDIGPHGLVRVAHGTGASVSARVDRHVAAALRTTR
jgi:hypothetical protein